MKLKLWKLEVEFDERDAKIVVPLIISGLTWKLEVIEAKYLVLILTLYYIGYFYLSLAVERLGP